MARTAEGRALTQAQRRRQLALRAATIRDVVTLWPLFEGTDLVSYQRFVAAASVLIRARQRDSAGLAANYYRAFRIVENVDGTAEPVLAPPPDAEVVTAALRATGLAATLRAARAGFSTGAARQRGLVAASGSAGRMVLSGGRDTVIGSVRRDDRARGWVRVTDADPCAFCALLSGRGPVFSEDTADFDAHDHCSCGAEPHFSGAEWPGRAREFEQLYARATREAAEAGELNRGTSNDLLNAFRREYEGSA